MKKAWDLSYPLSAQQILTSDRVDAQADLRLLWAHRHFAVFVISRLMLYDRHMFNWALHFRLNFSVIYFNFEKSEGHTFQEKTLKFIITVQNMAR